MVDQSIVNEWLSKAGEPTNYSQEVAEQARMAAHNIAQAVRSELNLAATQRPVSSNKGFTLIELAIVLVIVGLLATSLIMG